MRYATFDALAEALGGVAVSDSSLVEERDGIVADITGYMLPRLEGSDRPTVVAVVGPPGAGTSSVVNGLVDMPLSPEGPVRPVTVHPVVVAADRGAPRSADPVAALVRSVARIDPDTIVHEIDVDLVESLVLVDVPTHLAGIGELLVTLVDHCLYVVTPARYADATVWQQLDDLTSTGVPVTIVLNRSDDDEVAADLRTRLAGTGTDAGVVVLAERSATFGGIETLRAMLSGFDGAVATAGVERRAADLADRTIRFAEAAAMEREADVRLAAAVETEYGAAADAVRTVLSPAGLGPGAATSPWQAVADRLVGLLTHEAGRAAERTASVWSHDKAGIGYLDGDGAALWRHDAAVDVAAREVLLAWPAGVEALVERQAKRRIDPAKRREIAGVVQRRALGGEGKLRWWTRRKLSTDVATLATDAHGALVAAAIGILDDDAARFMHRIGRVADAGAVAEVTRLGAAIRPRVTPAAQPPIAQSVIRTGAQPDDQPEDEGADAGA